MVVMLVVISFDDDGGRTSFALFSTAASSTIVFTCLNTRPLAFNKAYFTLKFSLTPISEKGVP